MFYYEKFENRYVQIIVVYFFIFVKRLRKYQNSVDIVSLLHRLLRCALLSLVTLKHISRNRQYWLSRLSKCSKFDVDSRRVCSHHSTYMFINVSSLLHVMKQDYKTFMWSIQCLHTMCINIMKTLNVSDYFVDRKA